MTDFRSRREKRIDAMSNAEIEKEANQQLSLLASRIDERDAEIATLKLAVETLSSKLADTSDALKGVSDDTQQDLENHRARLAEVHGLIMSIGDSTKPQIAATHDHHSRQMTDILAILKDL